MPDVEISQKELEISPDTISEIRVDASFRKLTKNSVCFHIWRIEEDRLEAVPRANFGIFYDDCCYIIYAASPVHTYVNHETITREGKTGAPIERFIHFWLGENVSQQKKANVAHKVMDLDLYFDNIATQFRESQENESTRFMSYFKKGITILSGALTSSTNSHRLFQIKGRQWLWCIEMETISWNHFSSEFIMILSTGRETFIWIGRSSNSGDRREALEIAKRFHNDNESKEIVIVDDGYEQSLKEEHRRIWNAFLPRDNRVVNQGMPIDKPPCNSFKLYKCGYKGSKYWIDQITATVPNQADLNDSEAVYILNGFSLGVWMWIGKNVTSAEATEAIKNGRGFIKKKKYPSSTLLIRVVEGHEPIEFINLFPNWIEIDPRPGKMLGKFDNLTLARRPKMAAEAQLIDDGTGEKQLFEIAEDHYVEVPLRKSSAIVLNENCYIVQYTVTFFGLQELGVKHIIYVWIGKLALSETITKCLKIAKDRLYKLGERTMMVKVAENYETPHFLQIFSGKFVILQTELNATSVNECSDNNNIPERIKKTVIFKVHGDSTYTSKAIQVHPLHELESRDCYVIRSSLGIWVWCGQSSTGDAREAAKNIGTVFGAESTLVIEGKEPKEFWSLLSDDFNRAIPAPRSVFDEMNVTATPIGPLRRTQAHLHLVYTIRSKLVSHEILGFEQGDLQPENCYILDAGPIAYVWCGKLSPLSNMENFILIAEEFLENYTVPRRESTAVALVRQGDEPNTFTGLFSNWSRTFWDKFTPYEKLRSGIITPGCSTKSINSIPSVNQDNDFDLYHKYPLSMLQQEASSLPSEVNPLKREAHLTHDDFVTLFGMTFSDFDGLPAWRKQELKKKHKLF